MRVIPILTSMILLGVFISCGSKTDSPTAKATSAPAFLSLTEVGCVSAETIPIHGDAIEFSQRVQKFVIRYNQATSDTVRKLSAVNDQGIVLFSNASPLSPLIISEDILETSLSNLEARFRTLIGEKLDEQLRVSEDSLFLVNILNDHQHADLSELILETRELAAKTFRWQSLRCSFEELSRRQKNDIRSYYILIDSLNAETPNQEMTNLSALELCKDFHSPAVCTSEQAILQRNGLQRNFVEHYKKQGSAKLDHFFSRFSERKFSCQKVGSQTFLEIPYISNITLNAKLKGDEGNLERAISEKWSGDNFKVKLKKVEKKGAGVIDFKWLAGGVSFVDRDEPYTINLSQHLVDQQLLLTIEHELGHVLGFPDCYHEFYDRRKKELVYYSLDDRKNDLNLMCSLSSEAVIPQVYFDQLLKSACK